MRNIYLLCASSLITFFISVNLVFAQSGATDTSSCAAHLNTSTKPPTVGDLLNCLAEMQREIDELHKREPAVSVAPPEIPSGAVIAFDRPSGCPEGWTEFTDGGGRFIIGVDGAKYKLPYVAGRPEYQMGGEEAHTLTVEEMPIHAHRIKRTSRSGGGVSGVFVDWNYMGEPNDKGAVDGTADNGGSQPHNNMPPYIALYFCKKD